MLTLGQRLRTLREAAGLSQQEQAELASVSADAVSSLEPGRRRRLGLREATAACRKRESLVAT